MTYISANKRKITILFSDWDSQIQFKETLSNQVYNIISSKYSQRWYKYLVLYIVIWLKRDLKDPEIGKHKTQQVLISLWVLKPAKA